MKNNKNEQFTYNSVGYLNAQKWLKETNQWDNISTKGQSTDGFSIVHAANILWEKTK